MNQKLNWKSGCKAIDVELKWLFLLKWKNIQIKICSQWIGGTRTWLVHRGGNQFPLIKQKKKKKKKGKKEMA